MGRGRTRPAGSQALSLTGPREPLHGSGQNGRLPGFSGFSAATRSKWPGEQITATTAQRDGDARRYLRMLTARAMTRATVTIDTPACTAMAPLAQRDSGMTSVGLKAVALVNATYR